MRELHIITDMQYGSCGKGLFAGYLAKKVKPDTLITAWAPNAGHTYVSESGERMVHMMIPNGIVAPEVRRILIGPGSVIDPKLLLSEIDRYKSHYLSGVDIMVHPHAAVVTERHREQEAGYGFRIGSTMKGVGAAMMQKIKRDSADINIAAICRELVEAGLVVSKSEYDEAVDESEVAIIEGAQGFSLGINSGFYPYVTSRECTVAQMLSDCAIPMGNRPVNGSAKVYGVCRTFPIRVANRKNAEGVEIGWSGPHYDDQEELTWGALGQEPELTTVTKLPRRVFTFSMKQIEAAVRMNGVTEIFLNFCNYMPQLSADVPGPADPVRGLMSVIEESTGARVRWTGWGPKVTDIREV